jgi:serine/threonine-protein kinase
MVVPDAVGRGSFSDRVVGAYRIHELIGRGGMGEVYRADDTRLGRAVAVKVLPDRLADQPGSRKRFLREARFACRVVHPYVATVFDVIEEDERVLLVMEHIEGRRLDVVLRTDRPDLRRVTEYALEMAEAVGAIHRAGLVHRDLKPGNVMVTPSGHVKVMDFGIARPLARPELREPGQTSKDSTFTDEPGLVGTLLYMSPEQVRRDPVDYRSDLFAFGTILYKRSRASTTSPASPRSRPRRRS